MSYGIVVKSSSGSDILNSENGNMLLLDVIFLSAGLASGSKQYPDAVGLSVLTQQIFELSVGGLSNYIHSVSVSYSGSVPVVNWTLTSGNIGTTLYVFAS